MCDIQAERLATSAAQLREQGAEVEAIVIDLADPESITHAFARIARGGINGLVNNAALATG